MHFKYRERGINKNKKKQQEVTTTSSEMKKNKTEKQQQDLKNQRKDEGDRLMNIMIL